MPLVMKVPRETESSGVLAVEQAPQNPVVREKQILDCPVLAIREFKPGRRQAPSLASCSARFVSRSQPSPPVAEVCSEQSPGTGQMPLMQTASLRGRGGRQPRRLVQQGQRELREGCRKAQANCGFPECC